MLASPFVWCSDSRVRFRKTCIKTWMALVCLYMHNIADVYIHWNGVCMCTDTLWSEGHPALFSWLCGGFLLPVNLSCAAHGPAVVGWQRGHWQGYWGNAGEHAERENALTLIWWHCNLFHLEMLFILAGQDDRPSFPWHQIVNLILLLIFIHQRLNLRVAVSQGYP